MTVDRPQPDLLEHDTRSFWAATKNHQLLYGYCTRCEEPVFYPRRHCPECGFPNVEERISKGQGTVYTFTVVRQHPAPFFRDKMPYCVAYVDVDEGFRILTEIDAAPEDVRIGLPVSVRWEDHDDYSIPYFVHSQGE